MAYTYNFYILASEMYRHSPSFTIVVTVREQLAHKLLQGKASLLEHSSFSVLCKDNIVFR